MKKLLIFFLGITISTYALQAQTSPNGKVRVYCNKNIFTVSYQQNGQWQDVMKMPVRAKSSKPRVQSMHEVDYQMLVGKSLHCSNAYNQAIYSLSDGSLLRIRAYNDGVTWSTSSQKNAGGLPDDQVDFSSATNNWLMSWSDSYEGFFPKNRSTKPDEHFGYPALFEYRDGLFGLLVESNIDSVSAASSFFATAQLGVFNIRTDGEGVQGDRTLILGTLSDLVASTLVNDNSQPNRLSDTSWIEPGVASWVYWAYNHGSKDYNIIQKYTDMAVELKLPYVLIDAEWDEAPDMEYAGEKMPMVEAAVRYANEHGVKPMIWYNSSVGWVNGAPGPKFRLNKPEDREREFAWCEKIGVKGVKIDFFSGDNNLNMRYMVDLLESAAKHHLLVNFHGAPLPRGLQRTYPNLISTEGVYGAEWYNNVPTFTKRAASHNAMLPFTRNVVGSMDYTPCAWTDSQHPHITTWAHELALTVLFESGIQHLADRPESFLDQWDVVKLFFAELPTAWDETRYIAGYPGESAVLARRKGDYWYVAGINGTDEPKDISLGALEDMDLDAQCTTMFIDTDKGHQVNTYPGLKWASPMHIQCQPRGGFVLQIKLNKPLNQ